MDELPCIPGRARTSFVLPQDRTYHPSSYRIKSHRQAKMKFPDYIPVEIWDMPVPRCHHFHDIAVRPLFRHVSFLRWATLLEGLSEDWLSRNSNVLKPISEHLKRLATHSNLAHHVRELELAWTDHPREVFRLKPSPVVTAFYSDFQSLMKDFALLLPSFKSMQRFTLTLHGVATHSEILKALEQISSLSKVSMVIIVSNTAMQGFLQRLVYLTIPIPRFTRDVSGLLMLLDACPNLEGLSVVEDCDCLLSSFDLPLSVCLQLRAFKGPFNMIKNVVPEIISPRHGSYFAPVSDEDIGEALSHVQKGNTPIRELFLPRVILDNMLQVIVDSFQDCSSGESCDKRLLLILLLRQAFWRGLAEGRLPLPPDIEEICLETLLERSEHSEREAFHHFEEVVNHRYSTKYLNLLAARYPALRGVSMGPKGPEWRRSCANGRRYVNLKEIVRNSLENDIFE
ncbi:hypothetical protein CPB84DRAFT_1785948 [Gymnopilus junonius]|uniref:Uncharacterized protein n=1 Tax=Gymnopilus junonius TaxID=109634 RepID=A0A9P5NIP6_GYMJU|nr:hypothetical protein CPB84DRAFT_1785948 [Gymnopilus junonius]